MSEKSPNVPIDAALRLTLAFGLVALLMLAVMVPFFHVSFVRQICGGLGCTLAPIGAGIGVWSAVRLRSPRVLIGSLPALAACIGWTYFTLVALRLAAYK